MSCVIHPSQAANAGHLDICKYLFRNLVLKHFGFLVSYRNRTALHFCSVLQIPGKGAEVSTEVQDGTRRTALHAAAQMGFASVVQKLGTTFDVSVLGVAGFGYTMVCLCLCVCVRRTDTWGDCAG